MSKKLFLRLIPLLAVTAFAVVPSVASAETENSFGQPECVKTNAKCHFYSGVTVVKANKPGPIAEGKKVPILSWGTLTLKSGAGTETCQNAVLAYDENPTGGGAGHGATLNFSTAACVSAGCEPATAVEVLVTPEKLPWGLKLEATTEGGAPVIRTNTFDAAPGEGLTKGEPQWSEEGAKVVSRCVFRQGGPPGSPTPNGYESKGVAAEVGAKFLANCEATEIPPKTKPQCEAEATATGKATGEAVEVGEIERQDVGGNQNPGFKGLGPEGKYEGYPEIEPGRPFIQTVLPGAKPSPVSICNGSNAPKNKAGSSVEEPGTLEFDQPKTGALGCGTYGAGETTGKLHTLGYSGEELINTY